MRLNSSLLRCVLVGVVAASALPARAQRNANQTGKMMEAKLQSPEVIATELQKFALTRIARLPTGETASSWTKKSAALRERYLREVVFHGWPEEWVIAPLRADDCGLIPTGGGYRLRKIRFEIVPGFFGVALLYEPERLEGRMPAVLNVDGHDAAGKSAEYKQKRCINQALRGMLALNIEFLGFGEMSHAENVHQTFGPHLDLVGANAVGLFHLAMRKGLDYLHQHPNVDPARIAMTGLSGGGWQTAVLSGLDERVTVSIPVAGHCSLRAIVESRTSIGDIEQTPTDMQTVLDYAHLNAMRAPRPTLLIYNAEDDCCFRAGLVKESIYDAVRPFYRLHGAEEKYAWYMNTDPGYHNYQLDNRQAAYRFFAQHMRVSGSDREIRVDAEVRPASELVVGLPPDNLTMLGLARQLASRIKREPIPEPAETRGKWADAQRKELGSTVRHVPTPVAHAFAVESTHNRGVETIAYRFEFANGLSASAYWLRLTDTPEGAPATMVVADKGKAATGAVVNERMFRGEQVLVVDPLFVGDSELPRPGNGSYIRLIYTLGERPLGLQSAQLAALATWLRDARKAPSVRLESDGLRTQTMALITAALNPAAFSELTIRNGVASLGHLLQAPIQYAAAPDLFSLDLYRKFDFDRIEALCGTTRVTKR